MKSVNIRLEGTAAAVGAARERIAAVLDVEVRTMRPRRAGGFVHQYLVAVLRETDQADPDEGDASV